MADFNDHILQFNRNLSFLTKINKGCNDFWDWQTTTCFYTAVHLIDAHLASVAGFHYRTHEQVNNAINPFNTLSTCSLPQDIYVAYINLQWLSRRSRYLISDDKNNRETKAFFTSDKHFAKAIRNLDILINYFSLKYNLPLTKSSINCDRLKTHPLSHFEII